jgi:hypothetical protein
MKCGDNSAQDEGEGQYRKAFWPGKHRIEVYDCRDQAAHLQDSR